MGNYLSQPVTDKVIRSGRGRDLCFCLAEMQGWRRSMQDASIQQADLNDGNSLFAVFDGHGGHEVSQFVSMKLVELLLQIPAYQTQKYSEALLTAFEFMDKLIASEEGQKQLRGHRKNYAEEKISNLSGCTANVLLLTPDKYIVANIGDSRSVLYRNGRTIPLSTDHKPENDEERRRIQRAGGTIENGRINRGLNLSRAFGDFAYKNNRKLGWHEQMIIAKPEIFQLERRLDQDRFILMGCDGIWERYLDNSDVLMRKLSEQMSKQEVQRVMSQLLDFLLATKVEDVVGCDNMTAILIKFS